MKILLAFTPFHMPTSPPFGLAYLKAALAEKRPDVDVQTIDWNLAFFRRWLRGEMPDLCSILLTLGGAMMSHLSPAELLCGFPGSTWSSSAKRMHYILGQCYEVLNQPAEALESLEWAEDRDWLEPEINKAKARCLQALNRGTEARRERAKACGKQRHLSR